jgi:hypothetical protein
LVIVGRLRFESYGIHVSFHSLVFDREDAPRLSFGCLSDSKNIEPNPASLTCPSVVDCESSRQNRSRKALLGWTKWLRIRQFVCLLCEGKNRLGALYQLAADVHNNRR